MLRFISQSTAKRLKKSRKERNFSQDKWKLIVKLKKMIRLNMENKSLKKLKSKTF